VCAVVRGHPADRGCDSDDNMFIGHVEQIGCDEQMGTLLLRCPRMCVAI